MKQTLKVGTLIEFKGTPAMGGFPAVPPEKAKIGGWTKISGDLKNHVSPTNGGWHIIVYADGGRLCCHESGFRIIDNRPGYRAE